MIKRGERLNLVFLGPPGAGKGTQARMAVDRYDIPQISTGDLMREAVSSGSFIGQQVKEAMASGSLVSDDLIISVLLNRLDDDDCNNGFILDGFPRNIYQAKSLGQALAKCQDSLLAVVGIELSDELIIHRLADRRICRECGASYHLEHIRPRNEGHCDRCNGELYLRKDDTEEVIRHRLEVYHSMTSPLINFYRERNKLHLFDGSKKIEMIFFEICVTLDRLS